MPIIPRKLGPRGRKLWRDLHPAGTDIDPATEVLITEACRIADRLERLDGMLRGQVDEWMRLEVPEGGSTDDRELIVVVNAALSEARLQATTLRGLLAPLTKSVAPAKPAEVSASDEVARRRAARRAAAASP